MFELLKEIAPGLKRVAMLLNPDSAPGHGTYYSHDFDAAAKLSKLELVSGRAYNDAEIEAVMTSLAKEQNGRSRGNARLFYVQSYRANYFAGAAKQSAGYLPLEIRRYQKCGFAFLRARPNDIVRRGAAYIDRVLRGEKPADLPVQVPVKFEMAINVKTAVALGLAVPPSMLLQADEVIE